MEVDDAGAESESSVDDGVREVGFAAVLQLSEELAIEVVEIGRGVLIGGIEVGGDEAECGDAERVGERLEPEVAGDLQEEMTSEVDIFREHLGVAFATYVLEREPDLEGAEAA